MEISMENMLVGKSKNGTTPVIKKEHGRLIRGLQFSDGEIRWFADCYIGDFYGDVAVYEDDKSGVINRLGEFVFDPEFTFIEDFSENRAFAISDLHTVLLNAEGEILKSWDEGFITTGVHNGIARVSRFRRDNKSLLSGYINQDGEWVIRMIEMRQIKSMRFLADTDDWYSDGLLRYSRDGLYGFIDLNCNTVIPCQYKNATKFDSGMAGVRTSSGWGYIDKDNCMVIKPEYDAALPFYRGLGLVKKDGSWFVVTSEGEVINRIEADSLHDSIPGYIVVGKNFKHGLVDYALNEIFPTKYGFITAYRDGILSFSENGRRGYADESGNELICDIGFTEEITCQSNNTKI